LQEPLPLSGAVYLDFKATDYYSDKRLSKRKTQINVASSGQQKWLFHSKYVIYAATINTNTLSKNVTATIWLISPEKWNLDKSSSKRNISWRQETESWTEKNLQETNTGPDGSLPSCDHQSAPSDFLYDNCAYWSFP